MNDNNASGESKKNEMLHFKVFYVRQTHSPNIEGKVLNDIFETACEQAEQKLEPIFGKLVIDPAPLEPSFDSALDSDIKTVIKNAVLCIFEISDLNMTSVYEAGIADGLGKSAGLLVEKELESKISKDIPNAIYFPYDKKRPHAVEPLLSSAIFEEVKKDIECRPPLSQWFWEKLTSSPAKLFLGRTTEDNFSWGDVGAMDLLRIHFKNQKLLELDLKSDIQGDVLEQQVISIGGPRRNKITESILTFISKRARYHFIDTGNLINSFVPDEVLQKIKKLKSDTQSDPFVIYDRVENELYSTEINFTKADEAQSEIEKKEWICGTDYGLVYRIANPTTRDIYWTVFMGISRAGSLACLKEMLKPETLWYIRSKLKDDNADIEILFEVPVVNGRGIGATPIECRKLVEIGDTSLIKENGSKK